MNKQDILQHLELLDDRRTFQQPNKGDRDTIEHYFTLKEMYPNEVTYEELLDYFSANPIKDDIKRVVHEFYKKYCVSLQPGFSLFRIDREYVLRHHRDSHGLRPTLDYSMITEWAHKWIKYCDDNQLPYFNPIRKHPHSLKSYLRTHMNPFRQSSYRFIVQSVKELTNDTEN